MEAIRGPWISWLLVAALALALLYALTAAVARADEPKRVVIAFHPAAAGRPDARQVFVAGEFNGWDQRAWPLQRGPDGFFRRTLELAPGIYRYKLIVDGEWLADPANPLREAEGHQNSVLVVGDLPVPDLSARAGPSPREARPDAFEVVPAADLPTPPAGVAPRPLYVYLPPSYASAPERRYPVLYLHDGQNVWSDPTGCFGHGGWYLDATCDRLVREGALQELILVGVPHGEQRMREYGTSDLLEARSDPYVRYLVAELKPWVDQRYRTKPGPADTGILGSSMGGLHAFTLALTHPEVFGQAACLSSSFWFEDGAGKSAFDLLAARGRQPVRLYLDSGTGGSSEDGAPNTRRMRDALRAAGWEDGRELQHHEAEGAEHNERAWRARAALPLRFLFGSAPAPKARRPARAAGSGAR